MHGSKRIATSQESLKKRGVFFYLSQTEIWNVMQIIVVIL